MKIILALSIAALSAIESFLLALLFISLLVAPGGSGEFTGINQVAHMLFAGMVLPPLAFVIVLVLILKYHTPENHKDFLSFAWALATAVAMIPIVLIFSKSPNWGRPRALGINAIVLLVWTGLIIWRRLTRDREDSFDASA